MLITLCTVQAKTPASTTQKREDCFGNMDPEGSSHDLSGCRPWFQGFCAGLLGPMHVVSWQCGCMEEAVDFMTGSRGQSLD